MKIININGPINAGKTTISKLLAQNISGALFIEVDDLLSDDERNALGLSVREGWMERVNRLAKIIAEEKKLKRYENIIFAYPITEKLYNQ